MTLIVTTITELGILQASDSNLTSPGESGASPGQKVFPLGFCPGALALSGDYMVGHEAMDVWMPEAIEVYSIKKTPTLGGFARYLGERLTREGHDDDGLLIHVAGYATDGADIHPEMWFVRNYKDIDLVTGDYSGRSRDFQVSEDFWARDYPAARRAGRRPGTPFRHWYFNGFPAGRATYNALRQQLLELFDAVWDHPNWKFRRPTTIEELAIFMRLEIDVIAALFKVSDYDAPYVGGEAQVQPIAAPAGSIDL